MPPETFFPMVDRFIQAYKKVEQDLENWKKIYTLLVDLEQKLIAHLEMENARNYESHNDENKQVETNTVPLNSYMF